MSSFFIFILQIATLNIGIRTVASPFSTFRTIFLSFAALQTYTWYLISAWWFAEAYIWSSTDLSWVTPGSHSSPDRLNEKPIFFRFYVSGLAICAASVHLYSGQSNLYLPVSRVASSPTPENALQSTHPLESVPSQLSTKVKTIWIRIGAVLVYTIISPFVYSPPLIRWTFWSTHLFFAKIYFNISHADSTYRGYPPLGVRYLLANFLAGLLLVLTWETTTFILLRSLTQEPTKSGLPLSSFSKDPNGTLLNGLRAKRDVVKTFAFWELAIIAQKHKDRRKAIFEDIERPAGPIWTQMQQSGLKVLQDLVSRVEKPNGAGPDTNPPTQTTKLPRIVGELSTQSIYANPPPNLVNSAILSPLRQLGSSQKPFHLPVKDVTKAVDNYTPWVNFQQWIRGISTTFVRSIFKASGSAKINAAVLGFPNGNAALLVDIIESITKMLVASLSEDTYGKATPTVPEAVIVFTRALTTIESFIDANKDTSDVDISEVEIVVDRLRAGLQELLAAFQLYLVDVGLGITELNQAKRAASQPNPHARKHNSEKTAPQQAQPQQKSRQEHNRHQQQEGPKQTKQSNGTRSANRGSSTGGASGATSSSRRLFPRREMEEVR